jgi:cobaltochelatase CobN
VSVKADAQWMYACLAEQYVLDPQMQQFFQEKNPWALQSIIERLMEATQRGLWAQPDQAPLAQMRQLSLQLEGELEERTEHA